MLQICGVQGYIAGTVQHLDPAQDPEGASNWDFNDTYAKVKGAPASEKKTRGRFFF